MGSVSCSEDNDPIEQADEALDCSAICDRYQDCFDEDYDTDKCVDRCETRADDPTASTARRAAAQRSVARRSVSVSYRDQLTGQGGRK
jgi:hypothetical protein